MLKADSPTLLSTNTKALRDQCDGELSRKVTKTREDQREVCIGHAIVNFFHFNYPFLFIRFWTFGTLVLYGYLFMPKSKKKVIVGFL
jgi:hypothetical protein